MKYLLDSNTCIRYINGRSTGVARMLQRQHEGDVVVCSIVKAELFFGSQRSNNPESSLAAQEQFFVLFKSIPFDDASARQYAIIRAYLTKQGKLIGANDLLIAAIALTHDLTLITHNTREFERIPNLKIEDWESNP